MKRCVGGVVAVRTPAGDLPPPDRRYTVAHRCTANLLGRFWCRSPQCRGRAVQKASELCTAHPRALRLAIFPPKKNAQKSSPSHTNGSTYTENHPRKEFTYTMKVHKTITYEYKNAPIPRRRLRHRFIVPPKTARHPLCQNRHRRRLPV